MFFICFNMFLIVSIVNFMDKNTTLAVTYLLLGISFLLLSTTNLRKNKLNKYNFKLVELENLNLMGRRHDMKKTSLAAVILVGLAAVIWTIRAVLEIVLKTYNESVFLFVLNVLCSVVWIVSFIVNLKRYRSNRENK